MFEALRREQLHVVVTVKVRGQAKKGRLIWKHLR